jgi:prepilin-type N-terminal cleavage/methylation domain-containing protein
MIMMNNRKAFTIVEMLIVVTIIALLLGILLPSIAMVRTKTREAAQKAQFDAIEMALEAFKQDYGDYPPSSWTWIPSPTSTPGTSYCGSQKLSEALLGWDLMGFHPQSAWRADGYDSTGGKFTYDPQRIDGIRTLSERKGPYLELAKASVFKLGDLYNTTNATYVLCDVYRVRKLTDPNTGKIITAGSPILYYKANTANKTIDPIYSLPANNYTDRIYNYYDNSPITSSNKLTANGPTGLQHPLDYPGSPEYTVFYSGKATYTPGTTYGGFGIGYGIRDPRIASPVRPYRPDSYILISAGPDGYYGTADDLHNY